MYGYLYPNYAHKNVHKKMIRERWHTKRTKQCVNTRIIMYADVPLLWQSAHVLLKKKLAKHDPPRTLNIPARPLYFIYYSAQPMSWAIIILSIFCSLGCFFVIPPHRANNAVHWHIADQFIFSYTTPLCFFTFITRPLFFFLLFSFTWDYHRRIPFFSRFVLSLIFQQLWSYSPGFLYSFPYTVTSQKVLVLYDSFFFCW